MKNRLTSLEHREGSGLVRYLFAVFLMFGTVPTFCQSSRWLRGLGDFYGNDKAHFLCMALLFVRSGPGVGDRARSPLSPWQFDFHFTESPSYLRGAGLLDESNPDDPKAPLTL